MNFFIFKYKLKNKTKMSNHQILVEEPSLNVAETLEVKNKDKELNIQKNRNEIYLIFRNQISKDTIILIDKTKIKTVEDIINILLKELKISKEDKCIRLFFKGRPLSIQENINDISNSFFLIMNLFNYRFYE